MRHCSLLLFGVQEATNTLLLEKYHNIIGVARAIMALESTCEYLSGLSAQTHFHIQSVRRRPQDQAMSSTRGGDFLDA